jgi:DNA-binding NarL/FixJ family response regulator
LSKRETEVLKQIAEGKSNAEIASALQLGASSVRVYTCRIRKKLGLKTEADLTCCTFTNDLTSPE